MISYDFNNFLSTPLIGSNISIYEYVMPKYELDPI